MSTKSQSEVSPGSSLPDGWYSSEIKKKIKRSFFKEDVAVKSYKCDVFGNDLDTSAKLYISNRAFYVVHRPKRKKLTTMPFTEIYDIKARSDQQGVEVFCPGDGVVYTFTGFQRPESAIAFILNFWNMIRKEKIVLRHCQLNSRTETSSSPSQRRMLQDGTSSATPESLRLPQIPTTISLNSSASISDTDSMDSRRCGQDIKSLSSDQFPSSLGPTKSNRSPIDRSGKSSIISARDATQTTKPNVPNTAQTSRSTASASRSTSDNRTTDNRSSPPPSDQSDPTGLNSAHTRRRDTGSVGLRHSTSDPNTTASTNHYHHLHNSSRPMKQRHPCLSETPGWSLWPLSFLPYPFSSPPQRLTMIIAYAILGFLLFSTMHLYHRLAVFDLQGSPFVRTTTTTTSRFIPVGSSTGSCTLRSSLQSLDRQLAQLVELTSQLAQSMMQLTGEMRNMQFDAESSAAPPQPPPGTPSPQSAPPV